MRPILALIPALAAALPALAEPVQQRDARRMLFDPKAVEVAIPAGSGLSDADRRTVEVLIRDNDFGYYGAIAYSPDEGLLSEALQGAFNYHDVGNASAAARAACDARRKAGTRRCVIAAQVRPRGWSPQPVQLSGAATLGLRAYRRGGGPKAFAVSPGTGEYAIAKGEGAAAAALAACNAAAAGKRAGTSDCTIVIAD